MVLSQHELQESEIIRQKFMALSDYLSGHPLPEIEDMDAWFAFVSAFSRLQGNISNDQSYLATLLAKRYLQARFPSISFDAAAKPQGARGLDIDETTEDGNHIVAEIKTTVPHKLEKQKLGGNQEANFRSDFYKLNKEQADHKFFFVTDPDAYQIVLKQYAAKIPEVEIVLLTAK